MADATHFLERSIERLESIDLERAMALYRDGDGLRWLLKRASLPAGEGRVAISLSEGVDGPYVVVTRQGDFVTCLAAEMRPGDCHVLAGAQIAALSAGHEVYRERWAQANAQGGQGHSFGAIVRPLLDQPLHLSQEQFLALGAWQPLVYGSLCKLYTLAVNDSTVALHVHQRHLRRRPYRRRDIQALHLMHKHTFAMGPLLMLLALDVRQVFFDPARSDTSGLSLAVTQTGYIGQALCAVWAVARMGKRLLPQLKRQLRQADNGAQFFDAQLGLLAIGLRLESARAEVRKALEPRGEGGAKWQAVYREVVAGRQGAYDRVFEDPAGHTERHVVLGREGTWKHLSENAPETLDGLSGPDDLPAELALAANRYTASDYRGDAGVQQHLLTLMPWAVQARGRDLFWPEHFIAHMRRPWKLDDSLEILQRAAPHIAKAERARSEREVGRNEPCPCGSGRKYKRCCLA